MKYIKTYEALLSGLPQIGDYVALKPNERYIDSKHKKEIVNFLKTNVGQIFRLVAGVANYCIKFDEFIPYEYDYYTFVSTQEIIFSSRNKEDVEAYIKATEFNL